MTTVKIKFEDGSTQTIQGDVVEIKHKDLPTTHEWTLKTVNVNGESETIDFIGERSSREER